MHKNNYTSVIGHTMRKNVICDINTIKGERSSIRIEFYMQLKLISIQNRQLQPLYVNHMVTTEKIYRIYIKCTPYTKISSKWTKELNKKAKIRKLENTGKLS